MYQGQYVLASLPARGGSKRLPRKNVLPLGGEPLIVWSIRVAQACPYVDAVVVSTDDAEIAEIAAAQGVEVRLRPAELAQDHSPSLPVFVDALKAHGVEAEVVLVLQPTSPFRRVEDLNTAVGSLVDQGADAVIAVSKAKLGPEWLLPLVDGLLQMPEPGELGRTRSQDQVLRYSPNGYLYAYTRKTLLEAEHYAYGARTLPLVVAAPYDLDIDDLTDFKTAEAIAHAFNFHCP